VTAWGEDSDGDTIVPPGLANVVAVAAGDFHNLALKSDGTIVAWGNNDYGQTNVPAGLTNVVAVAAGGWHEVALKNDGTIAAWGDDTYGQTDVPAEASNIVAIAAGKGGVTIGALDYPNVYYVDPRHPAAADEPPWGYPAVPLASLAKACAIAQPGETIVLRAGVYREVLAPKNNGVTVRAMQGEKVTLSGADLIEGWKREADGSWSAALAAEPKKVLRDGQPWSQFSYDTAAKRITVKAGGDPRLHLFETVLREQAIDLAGRMDVKIEEITVVDTLKPGAVNP